MTSHPVDVDFEEPPTIPDFLPDELAADPDSDPAPDTDRSPRCARC